MAKRAEVIRVSSTTEEALRNVVRAWEALPRGNHTPAEVEGWMHRHMKPAIDRARRLLGMPTESP
jgi:macrodomain Ter protein organizer (MatP/YcbG family)